MLPFSQICLWYSAKAADTYDINICIWCIIKPWIDPRPDLDRAHYGEKITQYKNAIATTRLCHIRLRCDNEAKCGWYCENMLKDWGILFKAYWLLMKWVGVFGSALGIYGRFWRRMENWWGIVEIKELLLQGFLKPIHTFPLSPSLENQSQHPPRILDLSHLAQREYKGGGCFFNEWTLFNEQP